MTDRLNKNGAASLFSKDRKRFLATCAVIALAVGCTVTPKPLSDWERAVRVDRDIQEMFGSQRTEVVSKPISLYDAMARALKYNLDARLKLMEAALAEKQYNLTSVDMLPKISAGAGYAGRSKYEAVVSKSMQTGIVSPSAYAYGDKSHGTADLQISWNVLDFGVSYFQARQDANKILIAKERRRKHNAGRGIQHQVDIVFGVCFFDKHQQPAKAGNHTGHNRGCQGFRKHFRYRLSFICLRLAANSAL